MDFTLKLAGAGGIIVAVGIVFIMALVAFTEGPAAVLGHLRPSLTINNSSPAAPNNSPSSTQPRPLPPAPQTERRVQLGDVDHMSYTPCMLTNGASGTIAIVNGTTKCVDFQW
jgi:hypothetical protein